MSESSPSAPTSGQAPKSELSPVESVVPTYEPEWKASGWKHPYVIYLGLTVLLFGFLALMGYLAWQNGWVPSRSA